MHSDELQERQGMLKKWLKEKIEFIEIKQK